jgi:CHASE3 domain sensor protein
MFKLSFRQQVLTGFGVSIVLVIIVGILSFLSIGKLEDDNTWVDHTQTVINTSDNLLQLMIDAETGMRGYGATDNKSFLDPYNKALPNIAQDVNTLKDLVIDNPVQVARVDSLNGLVASQLAILKDNIDTRDTKGLDFMIQNRMFLNGKQNMDQIRALVSKLNKTESTLLNERRASSKTQSTVAIWVIVVGSVIFLFIILFLFQYIQKTFDQQKKAEEEIRVTNIELEKVLADNENKNWLLTGTGQLNEKMQGQQSEKELSESVLAEVCRYTNAITGTMYLFDEQEETLKLYSYYAFHDINLIKKTIKLSEGWLGQVAKDKKASIIKGTLNDKLELETSIVSQELAEIMIVPFFFDKKLKGRY